jgi:glycosyltransferase involved in cell wall biosynthesis
MKLVVISICHNEEKTIGKLIKLIPSHIEAINEIVVVVINDGSTDKTAQVAKQSGAKVYGDKHQKRLPYRFNQAIEIALKEKADIAVNIDGDLQFNPKDIPNLLKPIIHNGYDFVAADRFTDSQTQKVRRPDNMPITKYFANRMGAWVVGKLSGYKFYDVTCGFRAYNRNALISLNLNSPHTYTQESFQILALKKKNIASVPIEVTYYKGRKSRVVKSFSQFLFGSMLHILRSFRDFAPLKFFGILGLVPFVPGIVLTLFVSVFWLQNGHFSPFKAVGLLGIYLSTLALIIWFLGLVADMLNRIVNNQEKILEQIKNIRWDDKNNKHDNS